MIALSVARYEPTAEEATFIDRFEDCTLPNTAFRHADHVRLTWLYLRMYSLLEALDRFVGGLKRFAASNHHASLYHETITWAFVLMHDGFTLGTVIFDRASPAGL